MKNSRPDWLPRAYQTGAEGEGDGHVAAVEKKLSFASISFWPLCRKPRSRTKRPTTTEMKISRNRMRAEKIGK